MTNQIQGENDSSITCEKTSQNKKYFLNDKKTANKLTKAAKADDLAVGVNRDKSFTLFLNTGSYVRTAIPLLKFYKKVWQSSTPTIRKSEVAGLNVKVKSVRTDYDKNRTPVQYTVKLIVDEEKVTMTFYETSMKILVQGGEKSVKFAEDALIPYLEREIKAERKAIKGLNTVALKMKFSCDDCETTFDTNAKLKKHFVGHRRPKPPTRTSRRLSLQESIKVPNVMSNQSLAFSLLDEVLEISSRASSLSPEGMAREEQPAHRLERQDVLQQSQMNISKCQELLSGYQEGANKVDVVEVEKAGDVFEPEEETGLEIVELQSSQLLTSVLQNIPVQLEPGLLASLSSGRLQVLQLESTPLPAQRLDQQITRTKLTPWQDGDQSSLSEASMDGESESTNQKNEAGEKRESDELSGCEESITQKEYDKTRDIQDEVQQRMGKEQPSADDLETEKQPSHSRLWPLFYIKSPRSRITHSSSPQPTAASHPSKEMPFVSNVKEALKPAPTMVQQKEVISRKPCQEAEQPSETLLALNRMENAVKPARRVEQSQLGGASVPAHGMESEAPNPNFLFSWKPPIAFSQVETDLSGLPEPEEASLGDYLVYICRSVQSLIHMTAKTDQSLSSHASMIGSLQLRLNRVSDRQNSESSKNPASRMEDETSPIPSSKPVEKASKKSTLQVEDELNLTSQLEDEHNSGSQLEDEPNSASWMEDTTNSSSRLDDKTNSSPQLDQAPIQRPKFTAGRRSESGQRGNLTRKATKQTYTCNDCGFRVKSLHRLDCHISISHSRPNHFQALAPATLLVGDSHLKILKRKWSVEKALGRNGKLYTPGITYPSEDRAYCSTKDWPGAWHPNNSLEEVLPRLIKERPLSSAIVMAPCNDITNIR